MRFTAALAVAAFGAVACAQSTTASSQASQTVTLDPVQSSIVACLKQCPEDSVDCRARCNPVR